MKIELTYTFDSTDELARHMGEVAKRSATDTADIAALRAVAPEAGYTADQANPPVVADVTDPTVDVRTATPEPEITATHDSDGLPYDPEIHATPKSFTSEGQWRSKRGKSKEALEARAAFKANGGAVVPPVVAPVVPADTTSPVVRGMPMPAAAPAPVTYDALFNKTASMMDRGVIDYEGVMALYASIGLTDPAVLETNESMRAALFTALTKIEA